MRRNIHMCIKTVAALCALLAALSLAGCANYSIREDTVLEPLAPIDPEAGVARTLNMVCYYRLTNEDRLIGVSETVNVRSGERTELAVINTLLEGAPDGVDNATDAFPLGTVAEDVSLTNGVLSVTLSSHFLSELTYATLEYEAKMALAEGTITKDEYDKRLEDATEALYTERRLAIYSIVDTVTQYAGNITVQLYVESASGVSAVTKDQIGLDSAGLAEPLGELEYAPEYVVSADYVVSRFMEHICSGEYEKAYMLLVKTETDGANRPSFANFKRALAEHEPWTGYTLASRTEDAAAARYNVELAYTVEGAQHTAAFGVDMPVENGMNKVSYASFMAGLEGVG